MFGIAARRLGYRVHTFSPESDTPTGQVSDREWIASYDDLSALRAFAENVQVVTFEFENVPASAVETVAACVPVRPRGEVLQITQNRWREKTYLASAGVPVAPFRTIRSLAELQTALKDIGVPAVLKTAGFGYDGKGQRKILRPEDAAAAYASLGAGDAVLEAFIDFEREVSVIAARGLDGSVVHYGLMENRHRSHILDVTTTPAPVPPGLRERAVDMARMILTRLDVVGVMCVEMFVTRFGELMVNELAPRPHNSGHLTIDACSTSQFEQQLRAICGWPLGSTELIRPAAMVNLLGEVWSGGEPRWENVLALPDTHLHLYGKSEARPGRKMGHITVLANSVEEAREKALRARDSLVPAAVSNS